MIAKGLWALWMIWFALLAVASFALICWGLDELGWPWWLVGVGALLLTLLPGIGQIVAVYGLKATFGLSWLAAIGAVAGAVAVLMVLYALASWASDPDGL